MRCSANLAIACFVSCVVVSLSQAGERPRPDTDGPLVYHWEPVAGSHKKELYVSGHRIGVYDPDTGIYRRINADGTLSDPAPPPWKRSVKNKPVEPDFAPLHPPQKKKKEEEEGGWLPEWAGYAATVGLMGAAVLFGVVLQIRRQ
jgi:hypothetical protein